MSEFNNPAVLSAIRTLDISANDLIGANSGQRPDLLREQLILRTPDGLLWSTKAGQLVPAENLPVVQKAPVSLSANKTLAATDDGTVFNVTTAITVTIPNGLSPRPNVAFIPPPTGNLSIAVTGGALINGAATTLTRARSANPAGIVVQPYTESDGYGVSGS